MVEKLVSLNDELGKTEFQIAKFFRLIKAIGVVRTGPEPRSFSAPFFADAAGVSRAHITSPDKHNASSHEGSYSTRRAGNTSPSQAAAGASKPSNWSITAETLSGPSIRVAGATFCQANKNRTKSALETGSI